MDLFIKIIYNTLGFISTKLHTLLGFLSRKKYFLEFDRRPDDIFIASYMKSGTTWMQMILYQLTSNGNIKFRHISEVSPTLEDAVFENSNLDRLPSPRFLKTHVPQKAIPRNFHGRFIYLMRDGKDVAVSQYYHYKAFEKPGEELTFGESFKQFFLNKDKRKSEWSEDKNGWFGHLKGWLANKKKLDILYVKYEDLLKDFTGSLEKIIQFCGLRIGKSEYPRILKHSSFAFMKNHEGKFDPRKVYGNQNVEFKDFIRKGKTKEGEKYFNEEQNKIYEEMFSKFLENFRLVDCYNPKK